MVPLGFSPDLGHRLVRHGLQYIGEGQFWKAQRQRTERIKYLVFEHDFCQVHIFFAPSER